MHPRLTQSQPSEPLHPASPDPAVPALPELPLPPVLDADAVAKALRTFPAETAPGPTGLRVQHVRDALGHGGATGVLEQLTAVVNLLAQGRARATIAPLLAGAGLVALPKPSGGVRPIVGELFRRLTAKCLMYEVKVDAKKYFWPAQTGVIVKVGRSRSCCACTSRLG